MPATGEMPEHGAPGPPGGCAAGKLTRGAGGGALRGLRPGGLTGSRGSSRAVSAREVEPGCRRSRVAMGGRGPGRGQVPGNPTGLGACAVCPLSSCGCDKAEAVQKQVICPQTSIWEGLGAHQGERRQQFKKIIIIIINN